MLNIFCNFSWTVKGNNQILDAQECKKKTVHTTFNFEHSINISQSNIEKKLV